MEHRRRVTLFEQMSAVDSRRELAGLTLENILANQKRATAPTLQLSQQRTLLDVIREDNSSKKDKNSWRAFKEKLRLMRAGSFSDIPIPIPNNANRRSLSQSSRPNAIRYDTPQNVAGDDGGSNAPAPATRPQSSPQISSSPGIPSNTESGRRDRALTITVNLDANHHHTAREGTRRLSVREAMALQDAMAAPAEVAEISVMEPARMSLMDLLEETDEAMTLEIPTNGEEEEEGEKEKNVEINCCVCMVRQKGAAFIPCGHTFCRLCSRELWVQRGNCPLCNNSISEILDIF